MILSCQNICKSFGEKIILKDASFHIEDREKAAPENYDKPVQTNVEA